MNFSDYCQKVGLNVKQQFVPDNKYSDSWKSGRVTRIATDKQFVIMHTTRNTATAQNEADNICNNPGLESFHAVVGKDIVIETVPFKWGAHHAVSYNPKSIGIELVEKDIDYAIEDYMKYIAYACYSLGITPSSSTLLWHTEAGVSTSCADRLKKDYGKDYLVKGVTYYWNIAREEVVSGEAPKPLPKPEPSNNWEANVKMQSGYRFFPNQVLALRDAPSESANTIDHADEKDYIDYDRYVNNDGFTWIRSTKSGLWAKWREIDVENYGKFEELGSAPASNVKYINLLPIASKPTYGFYKPGVVPVAKNISGYLEPFKWKGLSYPIVGDAETNVYYIETEYYGKVKVFFDSSRATITNTPTYKN